MSRCLPSRCITTTDHHEHDLGRAWTWLIAVPFAFVAGVVAGEGLISAMGYESGAGEPVPLGPALLVGLPVILVVALPAYLAYHYGMRARSEGDRRGMLPALIAAMGGGLFLVANLAGVFAGR